MNINKTPMQKYRSDKKVIQAHVTPQFYKEFKKICVDKDVKMKDVLVELVSQFMRYNQ